MKEDIYFFADGQPLVVNQNSINHLAAHSEVTDNILKIAANNCSPVAFQKHSLLVDLNDNFGLWARTGKVSTDIITPDTETLFGYRKGRDIPSRISLDRGQKTSLIKLWVTMLDESRWVLITAYPTLDEEGFMEPLNKPKIYDDHWLHGSVEYWCRNALSYDSANIKNGKAGLYTSTWTQEILRFRLSCN